MSKKTKSEKPVNSSDEAKKIKILLQSAKQVHRKFPDKSLKFAEKAYKISQKLNLKSEIANSLRHIGVAQFYSGKRRKAIEYHKKSLEICRDTNDEDGIARSLYHIAHNQWEIGYYKKAIEVFYEVLEITDRLGNYLLSADVLNDLAKVYHQIKKPEKAKKYLKRAMKIWEEIDNIQGVIIAYNNLSSIAFKENKFEESKQYAHKAIETNIKEKFRKSIAVSTGLIGRSYLAENQPESALKYLKKSTEILRDIYSDNPEIANANLLVAQTYLKLGKNSKAKKYLDNSKKIYIETNTNFVTSFLHLLYSEYYTAIGNDREALKCHKRYFDAYSKEANEANEAEMAELNIKYELKQSKIEKAALQKAHEKLEKEVEIQTKHLKESEEKFHTIFDSSKDAMMLLAPPSWKFIAGNASTIEMFNTKDEQEFISVEPWKLSPLNQPDESLSSDKAKQMIEKAMKEGSNFFEWTHKRAAGEDFPATVLLTKIKIAGKELLQATVRDISERKKTENELLIYQNRLEKMVLDRTAKVSESYDRLMYETDERKITEKKIQMLSEVFREFGPDPKKNIDIIVKQTCEILTGVCTLYNRLDNEEKSLEVWSSYNAPVDLPSRDIPIGHICYEATIKSKDKIVNLGNLAGTEFEQSDPNVKKYGLKAYLGYPVTVNENTIGALCVVDTKIREFNKTELYIIATLAKAVSIEEERIFSDRALKESEERYRAIVENSHDAIYIYQADKFKFVSSKFCSLSGYTEEEIYQIDIWQLVHPDDKQRIQNYAKNRALGKHTPGTFLAKVVCKNGEVRECEFAVSITSFMNEFAVLGSVRDITERKTAELEIQKSEKKFSELFKGMSGGVVFCKAVYNSIGIMNDCIYEDMNTAYEKMTNLKKEKAVGKKVSEMLPGTDPKWFELLSETSISSKPVNFEIRFKPTSKYFSVFAYSSKKGHFTAIFNDFTERQRAENNLLASKEAYQSLFENSPVGIAGFSTGGTILEVNKELLSILGSPSAEETKKINILKFPPFVALGFVYDFELCIKSGKTVSNERFYTSKWDKNVHIRYILSPTHNANNEVIGVQGIFEDYTAKRTIENELRKTETKYEVLFKDAPDSILLVNAEGIILDCNKTECMMSGYEYDEICGKPVTDFFKPGYKPKFEKTMRTLKSTGSADIELELVDKSCNIYPVWRTATGIFDDKRKLTGIIVHTTNISTLKKAEKELQLQKDYYFDFVESLSDWVWEMDLNGIHTYSNNAVKNLLGYKAKEVIGKSASEFWGPKSKKALRIFEHTLSSGKGWENNESSFQHKDGSKVHVESSGVPIFDTAGNLTGYRGIDHNITDRLKAREELQKSKDDLKEINLNLNKRVEMEINVSKERNKLMLAQSRQAALGEMIGNIAHQWRQPLNTLGLSFQELQDAYNHKEFNKEKLDEVAATAMAKIKYMSQTIEDFRNFFKPMGLKEKFNIHSAIVSAVRLVKEDYLNKGIHISIADSEQIYIDGYKNEFAQVILNVLNNAKDAIMLNKITEPMININIRTKKGNAVVTIEDNGGGIPEEIIDRIFDPYFSTKAKTEGTGIGLYMSKMIIEKNMGGILFAESAKSKAKFTIKIKPDIQ